MASISCRIAVVASQVLFKQIDQALISIVIGAKVATL